MKDYQANPSTTGAESFIPSTRFPGKPVPRIPDHELLRPIGEGTYGEVWLARNIMGTYRAIKVVYRHDFDDDHPFDREFNGVKNFEPISRSHDGFVDILQIGRNEEDGYFYSVMELADPADGSNDINPVTYAPKTIAAIVVGREPLPYEQCLEFGLAASAALAFLHKRRLVHRDIKPSNLIVVHGLLKLADVGMVTEAGSASMAGGTIGYMAPEGAPSSQADVYSLGKVLYELSTGLDRLKHPSLPEFWANAPNLQQLSELNEIILKACEPDVTRRYASAEDLHRELALLEAGESVKRLRWLEKMLRLFRKTALIVCGIALLAAYGFWSVYQQRERESKRVADVHATAGAGLASQGDFLGALPWYAEALKLDRHRPRRAIRHSVNMETTIRYSPRIVRMFFEDTDVHDVAFSPDGRAIAESLDDGRILVRQLQTNAASYELSGHTHKVQSISWSPDGKHLLSASADRTARVWSTEARRVVCTLNHPGAVASAAFNSSGDLVVTGSAVQSTNESGGLLRLWRWDRAEMLSERLVHTKPVRAVAFSPDDRWIVSGGEDSFALVLESPSLNPATRFWHPDKAGLATWVYGACFSPDGKRVATAGFDHLARISDPLTFQPQALFAHAAPVRSVQFSPDQQFLLTACNDYTARIWDVNRQVEAFPPLRHSSFVLKASFSPDGRFVATATTGGIVTIWDLASAQLTPLGPVIYSPNGRYFARLETNSVHLFDAQTEAASGPSISTTGKIRDLKFTSDGKRLLVLSENGDGLSDAPLLAQLHGIDGTRLGTQFSLTNFVPESPTHFISGLSSDGHRVAVILGPVVQLWDTEHGRMVGKPISHVGDAGAAVSPDGKRLVSYSLGQVFLINALTGKPIKSLDHPARVDYAVFSPNNLLLATACRDNDEKPRAAYIWDVRGGSSLERKLQHQDGVSHLAFSADSQFLLTAGEDRIVKQWRVGSWALVRTYQYDRPFVSASFNHDGTRVVTVASDDTVRVWDAESEGRAGIPLTPPLKHPYNLWHARFIGTGGRVLAKRPAVDRWTRRFPGTEPGEAWEHLESRVPQDWEKSIWILDPKIDDVDQLRAMAELLSAQRIEMDNTVPLSTDDLKARWRQLNGTSLCAFDFSANQTCAWHRHRADHALNQRDAFAALFHLNRFMPLTTPDAHLREQVDQLRAVIRGTPPVTSNTPK